MWGVGVGDLVKGRGVALEKRRNSFMAAFSSSCLAWLKRQRRGAYSTLSLLSSYCVF